MWRQHRVTEAHRSGRIAVTGTDAPGGPPDAESDNPGTFPALVGMPRAWDTPGMGMPILLTVDDDPSVSRAVARDLRRRYGRTSGWCEPTRDRTPSKRCGRSSCAGTTVAAMLADYRMPQHGRHRVPRTGHGPVPARAPGAAHRVRRHRRRHPGDQPRRRRPLPAQAVGPAGGEALSGGRRAGRDLARGRRASRSRRPRSSGTAGPRRRTRCATSWPATSCRTAGTPWTSRRDAGCWTPRAPGRTTSRW